MVFVSRHVFRVTAILIGGGLKTCGSTLCFNICLCTTTTAAATTTTTAAAATAAATTTAAAPAATQRAIETVNGASGHDGHQVIKSFLQKS